MKLLTTSSRFHATFLGLVLASPLTIAACTNAGESVGASNSALNGVVNPIGGSGGGGIVTNPGGGWAPVPVYPASSFRVVATTSGSVTVGWTEPGGNGQTILYRQLYDLSGNPTGDLEPLVTFNALSAGAQTFTDQNPTFYRFGLGGSGFSAPMPIQPDRQIAYQLVEVASGYSGCEYTHGGQTCAGSALIDAFTQGSTPFGVGRAQLRVQVSDATGGSSSLHVRAELAASNATWLNSTQGDFQIGSNIVYDLKTDALDSRSDIQLIDLWSPDSDGICVSQLELLVDNTTTFEQVFPTCQWVGQGGSEILIPFPALRSSAQWQAYTPQQFPGSTPEAPVTFIGFDSQGLISYLDSIVGDQLKDEIPTAADGFNAGLGAPTTISRTDSTHLHVQQHLVNLDVVWDGTDFGTVSADPSYDLAIHDADATCAGWCVAVENASGNSSYGWEGAILDLINVAIAPIIEHEVNDRLESALSRVSSLTSPGAINGYCFAPATISAGNPGAIVSTFDINGTPIAFDEGSFVVCPNL
jgi:hypothetical protein